MNEIPNDIADVSKPEPVLQVERWCAMIFIRSEQNKKQKAKQHAVVLCRVR